MKTITHENEICQGLQAIVRELRSKDYTLEDIWERDVMLWRDLGWNKEQVSLWLRSLPGIQRNYVGEEKAVYGLENNHQDATMAHPSERDLEEVVAGIVMGMGKQVPIAEVQRRLPHGMIVTDDMIKKAVGKHPKLKMFGPFVKEVQ